MNDLAEVAQAAVTAYDAIPAWLRATHDAPRTGTTELRFQQPTEATA